MPFALNDAESNSAGSELGKAALASVGFAMGTELGFTIGGKALNYGLWKPTKAITKGIYHGVLANRGTIANIAKFTTRGVIRGAKMYGPQARDIAGGIVTGAYKGASWLYKHPVAMVGIAGGAGALSAIGDPNQRTTSERYGSPSIVEAMGGQSDYGVRGLMENMNASGSMVFGMNARR